MIVPICFLHPKHLPCNLVLTHHVLLHRSQLTLVGGHSCLHLRLPRHCSAPALSPHRLRKGTDVHIGRGGWRGGEGEADGRSEIYRFAMSLEVGVFDEHSNCKINENNYLLKSDWDLKEKVLYLTHSFQQQLLVHNICESELDVSLLHLKIGHHCLLFRHLRKSISTIF